MPSPAVVFSTTIIEGYFAPGSLLCVPGNFSSKALNPVSGGESLFRNVHRAPVLYTKIIAPEADTSFWFYEPLPGKINMGPRKRNSAEEGKVYFVRKVPPPLMDCLVHRGSLNLFVLVHT